ncbi:deoxyribose-phosphate aldolase [Emticicia sp. BO119]|uniref:deoxyribose-phosphate aldolase n=1 Tax=Emticicia sp. BO119 TaxID=2757768 RepID=UPI0015F05959|nr:deoxyribose-phosphate aldolase [Emticicia sp. BO119]MBA4850768.1 deoxyribose-phosphate aldolase [Emticicia sp. BO119]
MQNLFLYTELQLIHPKVSIEEMYAALNQVQHHNLAALFVPPFWVKKLHRDWGVGNTATLGTIIGYPYGYQRTEVKQLETELALKDGATDIELMLNTSAWFSNQNNWVKIEIAKLGKIVHQQEAFFTVAINTCHFDTTNLQQAIKDAIDAGADYIKIYQPFNLAQSLAIKQWIPDKVGLKLCADIATKNQMQKLVDAGIERLCMTDFLLE